VTALSVIFAGSGEFGLPTLGALIDAGHRIVQVVSQPDKPAGRGRKLSATAISKFAMDRRLDLTRTADVNRERLPAADVMVVIAFGQKIAEHVVNHPRLGSVNLHGSRLPRFRGAAPINAAVVAGESVTGNSVIRLAPKMDAGAVLAMSRLEIGALETAGELHDRLAADGAPLVLRVLEELATGRANELEQDHSQATQAPKLSRESSRIDWSRPADAIARQVRGMHPWPGCHVRFIGEDGTETGRATLVRARPTAAAAGAPPGQINEQGTVAATEGAVEILELQPSNGRIMSLSAYRNGHKWLTKTRVESELR
jgi:methionyl-tRNA formyltransferase